MNPLSLIPPGWLWPAAGVAAAALIGAAGVQTLRLAHAETQLASAKADYAAERTKATQALADAESDYRGREQAIATDHQEAEHAAKTKVAALVLDLDRSRAAVGSLRAARDAALAAARAQAACGAASQPSGAVAADPAGMLADVLGRADDRAGALAEFADRTRIAHEACVSEYAAVRERLAELAP